MIIIGIDNGVTGAVAVITNGNLRILVPTPVLEVTDYQSTKEHRLHRIDHQKLKYFFSKYVQRVAGFDKPAEVVLERPMINFRRFSASISAARSFEATLVILEQLGLPVKVVSSSFWQCNLTKEELLQGQKDTRKYLHKRTLTKDDNKQVYAEIAKHMFPDWAGQITNVNADAVLIAAIAYRIKEKK